MKSLRLLFLYISILNSLAENAGKSRNTKLETIFLSHEKNTVLSPFSIYSTLLPLELGSDGDTKTELQKLLQNFTVTSTTLPKEISSTTALLIAQDVKLEDTYSKALDKIGVQTIGNFNFSNYQYINELVRNATHGKIKEIVDESSLRKDTQMVLINGIYFQSIWNVPFQKTLRLRDFTLGSGEIIPVEMMYQKLHVFYGKLPELDAKVIDLPYKSQRQILRIYLPYSHSGLPKLLDKISLTDTLSLKPSMKLSEIELYMPPIKIESSIRVTSGLDQLGLQSLTKPTANLSKISNSTKFRVDEILCKTLIEISPDGTVGGSGTGAWIIPLSGFVSDDEIAVDRPFYFEIRDSDRQMIYFSGVFAQPVPAPTPIIPPTTTTQIPELQELEPIQARLGNSTKSKNQIPIEEDKVEDESSRVNETIADVEKWWIYTGRPEYLNMKNPEPIPNHSERGDEESTESEPMPRFQQPEPRSTSGIRFPYPLKDPNSQLIIDLHLKNMSLNSVI